MVKMEAIYEGGLRCIAVHGPSKTRILTDAPTDNHGKGESFSPTDLVATALATCIATTIGIWGIKHGVNVDGMQMVIQKEMTATPPRRIARIRIEITMARPMGQHHRDSIERCAHACPVHHALHPDVAKDIAFVWPAA
jgi:putative redox protein